MTLSRTLSAIAMTGAAALLLAACSGAEAPPPADRDFGTPKVGEVAPGVLDGVTLTYAGPGGIFQEGQDEAIWQPFAKESGATMQMDAFDSGKLKAMVDGGNVSWDLVDTSQVDSARGCGTLYEKIDRSLIDTSEIPEGTITDECMIPNVMYGFVIAYNTEAFGDNPPTSAADFFDTEKFPGKRTVPQTTYVDPQNLEFPLLADGVDMDNLKPEHIDQAIAKYDSLGDDMIAWSTGAQAQQQLESGEAVMGYVWSGRGYGAAEAGAPIAPVWDEWLVAIDSTAIPKGVKDPEASHAAINYFLGAKQQAGMTELNSMSPVNVNADPQVDDTLAEWLASTRFDTGHVPDFDFWVENYDAMAKAWATWVTGA
ncbi:putative spermidine/putrescine transport system substrate-binding protein [Leucobacter luti]|uniref:ABC transporter substrate-binding protein n=1 Tax=Leucobacter luti TaxID=340320 RepID=UPI0010E0BC1D|nr:ABC transporter substrate-binding protein [Leucobacter luti]MCW2288778.1 putative spermidine/putrescine transport system substrate-binding protein [Leucobacter luti]TCK45070.1 putative spermidine/putrescine transport system substrate-binding protein [Leucobacter luti]